MPSSVTQVPGTPGSPADASESLSVPFPEIDPPPTPDPCSFNECLAGHRWPVTLALGSCQGCSGGIVAVQKTNCPVCNEPIVRTQIRSDFLPRGAGLAPRCQGTPPQGESLDIILERSGWKDAEVRTLTFLEQEATTRGKTPKESK